MKKLIELAEDKKDGLEQMMQKVQKKILPIVAMLVNIEDETKKGLGHAQGKRVRLREIKRTKKESENMNDEENQYIGKLKPNDV